MTHPTPTAYVLHQGRVGKATLALGVETEEAANEIFEEFISLNIVDKNNGWYMVKVDGVEAERLSPEIDSITDTDTTVIDFVNSNYGNLPHQNIRSHHVTLEDWSTESEDNHEQEEAFEIIES